MSKLDIILAIDPGEHIGFAAAEGKTVLEAGVIIGTTETDRFGSLQQKLQAYQPSLVLIENSYKYKKKISHMLKLLPEEKRPPIILRDANQLQFRLFGGPYGKYGKDKTLHRQVRTQLVEQYFGKTFEVHANDALLLIVDWHQSSTD